MQSASTKQETRRTQAWRRPLSVSICSSFGPHGSGVTSQKGSSEVALRMRHVPVEQSLVVLQLSTQTGEMIPLVQRISGPEQPMHMVVTTH
jgi:hypothetical protein